MFRGVIRYLLRIITMSDEQVVEINGHKFKFLWRDVVQLGMFIAAIIGIYVTVTGRINDNSRGITELFKRADAAQLQREQMDRDGTRRSHEIDATQQQMIDYHTAQIADVNKKLSDMMPMLEKVNANVLWLMGKQLESRK